MRRPYLLLAGAVVVIALALTVFGRPHRTEPHRPAVAAAPMVELAITIGAGKVSPGVTSVPKGSRVRLRVEHRGAATARLALAGYEDRLEVPALDPGAVWTAEFLADRPGEDFAWLLDGQPAGRLTVTGSHLVDGHR